MSNRVEEYNTTGDQKHLKQFEASEENAEDLIYEFLKNLGEATERAYRRDLKAFFDFTRVQFGLPRKSGPTVYFSEIRRVHIVKYKKFLEVTPSHRKKKFAPNTINRKLSVVSSFFQFLLQREVVEKNPAEFCKRPSLPNFTSLTTSISPKFDHQFGHRTEGTFLISQVVKLCQY